MINYFVSLICGRLHLLIDPALQLIRVPEELLQMERVLQGSAAGLSAFMQGITAAEQLQTSRVRVRVSLMRGSCQRLTLGLRRLLGWNWNFRDLQHLCE